MRNKVKNGSVKKGNVSKNGTSKYPRCSFSIRRKPLDIDKNAVVVQILGLIYPYLHGLVQPRDSNLQKEQLIAGAGSSGAEPAEKSSHTSLHRPATYPKTWQEQHQKYYIVKGKHIFSTKNLLNDITQAVEAFLDLLNGLSNADLHGLEVLGLLLGINAAIAGFKKLVYHSW